MNASLTLNTQAILLLTAPLIVGRATPSSDDTLLPSEYKRLARFLCEKHLQPADLLASGVGELLQEYNALYKSSHIDIGRLNRLLDRGFLLSQAVERWQARAIWVVSCSDAEYPERLKTRLGENAPPVLYCCGDAAILEEGGLAVVGSRHVNDELIEYTETVGRCAARAERTIISGGARGIDQAAMRGALAVGGITAGILAHDLERVVMNREHRNMLMENQLALASPYDPLAGFNVGNAMQRNKLIYALADAALVVSSDYEKGGTWAGVIEQLRKLHLVPVYVRCTGEVGKGLEALRREGALPWPEPTTPESLVEALASHTQPQSEMPDQRQLRLSLVREIALEYENLATLAQEPEPPSSAPIANSSAPAEELFMKVRSKLAQMDRSVTKKEVAVFFEVPEPQAKAWLEQLVQEGVLERFSRPARYRPVSSRAVQTPLFGKQG